MNKVCPVCGTENNEHHSAYCVDHMKEIIIEKALKELICSYYQLILCRKEIDPENKNSWFDHVIEDKKKVVEFITGKSIEESLNETRSI
jgi:transcription initiation factor TFIIIB Brf1 subunit/transcription initiation factor TFIIB